MRLIEIYTLPSQDHPPIKYQHYFDNIIKTDTLSTGLVLKLSEKQDELHVGVFDSDILVAYVQIVKIHGHWQLAIQSTDTNHRSKGYIRRCIEQSVKHLGSIISDEGQTPESQMVWTALVKTPGHLKFGLIDLSTGSEQPLIYNSKTNAVDPNPWADEDPDIRIIASLKPLSEETLARMQANLEIRIKFGLGDPWIGQQFTEFNP